MIDRELGWEIMDRAAELNAELGLDVFYISVSSSEEHDVRRKYEERRVQQFITKPLSKTKLEKALAAMTLERNDKHAETRNSVNFEIKSLDIDCKWRCNN